MPKWGRALRSMKAPGTAWEGDQQPATMDDYVDLPDDNDPGNDNGGVHINSGIPNHAFYLAATALGGYAWETAGRVWYVTLTDLLGPESQFTRRGAGDRRGGAGVVRRRGRARGDGRLEPGRGSVVNVSIVRGGGFAGIATRTQLASDALPKAACRRLKELAAQVEPASDAAPRPSRRDALQGRGQRHHRHPHRDDAAGAGARADRLRLAIAPSARTAWSCPAGVRPPAGGPGRGSTATTSRGTGGRCRGRRARARAGCGTP